MTLRWTPGWMLALAVVCVTLGCQLPRSTPGSSRPHAEPGGHPGGACTSEMHAWVERCATTQRFAVTPTSCPSDGLVVVTASADPTVSLRVEIAHAPRQGFVTTGDWRLSPIGDYPDWQRTPAALRATFDRMVACVRDGGLPAHIRGEQGGVDTGSPHGDTSPSRPLGVPWLLALAGMAAGIAAGIAAGAGRRWRFAPSTEVRRKAAFTVGAWAATFGFRRIAVHPTFFHQNGQGPAWVGQIVTGRHHIYGPGFTELFGWVMRLAPDHPERAVFAWQGALAATAPLCAWSIARAAGAEVALATALALGVAIDPALCRGALSESYYGACTSLLFLAMAAVSSRAARAPVRSAPFVLVAIAAGLLIAQAARIHPICWGAAALTPLALFVAPGSLRHRVVRTVAATALIGAVVALTSGLAMRAVILSDFGSHWLGGSHPNPSRGLWHHTWPVGLCGLVGMAASRRPLRAVPRVVVLVATVLVMVGADLVTPTGSPAWIVAGYRLLYAPAFTVGIAALLGGIPRTTLQGRVLAVALAALLVALAVRRWPPLMRLPTDAIELDHALAWRDGLPHGARVATVESAGYYILTLPIYGGFGTHDLDTIQLDVTAAPPDLGAYGGNVFYYHPSICSTPGARAFCEAVEHHNRLEPVVTYNLPAVPSMAHLTYDTSPVPVGLYRVRTDLTPSPSP